MHNGEFKNQEVVFGIVGNKIVYGDLTGDGHDEAIIEISCGLNGATGSWFSEIFVYTMQNGQARLLSVINDNDMDRDFDHHYQFDGNSLDGTLWRIIDDGVKVERGFLLVERFVDGGRCCPKNIATMRYRWTGQAFVLQERPQKRPFSP